MEQVLALTDKFKAELPKMLQEHQAVVAALKDLAKAAKAENKPEHAHFAEKLRAHAQMKEGVGILIGEYLNLRLKK